MNFTAQVSTGSFLFYLKLISFTSGFNANKFNYFTNFTSNVYDTPASTTLTWTAIKEKLYRY